MLNNSRRRYALSGVAAIATLFFGKFSWALGGRKLFEATSPAEALKALAEKDPSEPSNRLLIAVPEISADASRVPVHLRSELPGTDMMLLMATSVVPPMVAQFMIPVGTEADIRTTIRLSGTTSLQLVVRAGGKLYSAQKEVKIAVPLNNKLLSE